MAPLITVIIPVYNEEAILETATLGLVDKMERLGESYEIILAENGSHDGTIAAARALAERIPAISYFSLGEPNYGRALREGILRARGRFIICEEIDLCDADFHRRAIEILRRDEAKLVIGSKTMEGANDQRPLGRRMGTLVLNSLLRLLLGFKGTDTHGLKAFERSALLPIVRACLVEKDIFASELVIRAERRELPIVEIPVRVLELRPPTIGLIRRVPNVLKNIGRLFIAIRIRGGD